MKVLVADDEAVMRDLFTQVLKVKGHDVVHAEDGKAAAEKDKKEHFDVIFMDIIMPRLDGVEALKEIKKNRPDATVVMMTGFSVEEKLREAMAIGAFDFLYKPFNIVEIIGILDKLRKREHLKKAG
jgi:two-component system, chemotaxis family, chemotaxis protein CheY